MSPFNLSSYPFTVEKQQTMPVLNQIPAVISTPLDPNLAAMMTRAASSQTYFTIRFLADKPLSMAAYQAYAYFRWVDDMLDQVLLTKADRLNFLDRQKTIIAGSRQGAWSPGLCVEERLVESLIFNHTGEHSGLDLYLDEMMAVMAFDAHRQGCLISEQELDSYTRALATAVTEALHYFIGHGEAAPLTEIRYLAVTAAHITHMLRDAVEDTAVGYYNIPQTYLDKHGITATDLTHEAYRLWVKERVQLARHYFRDGRRYLAQVENRRCRLAGYAYITRFELVLEAIEKDDYWLRAAYPERKSKKAALKMIWAVLSQMIYAAPAGSRATAAETVRQTEVNA